jgi:hypothetical protein
MEADQRGGLWVPAAMWDAMKAPLDSLVGSAPNERRLFDDEGVLIEMRLVNGSVKVLIVRSDGCITNEWLGDRTARPDNFVPLAFGSEDIESWGYYERVRQPSWRHPFKKVKVWKVRVWADGRLGESATP